MLEGPEDPNREPAGDGAALAWAIDALHPEPYRAMSREALQRQAAHVDTLDPQERGVLTVELMRMIASLGPRNGHTMIDPLGAHPISLPTFPLWLHEFDDGVFVVGSERSDLIGSELIAVNGVGIDDVAAAVSPLIAHDNEWTIRARRPTFVVNAAVLHGLELIVDPRRATFRLRRHDGRSMDVTLDATAPDQLFALLGDTRPQEHLRPEYLRRRFEWHWADLTSDRRSVHVGYNLTLGATDEVAIDVERLARTPGVGLVALDLRLNIGGDNRTYAPLLAALERIGERTPIAVLTSRATFSAAMQLIVDLEQKTRAIFIGEPTGGSPNQYGDATSTTLTSSGLDASIATIAWNTAGESDTRVTREPDISVPHDSTAFFGGQDRTLAAAIATIA